MPGTSDIIALNDKYLMNTFGQRGISIDRASGARVWDCEGKSYLDFLTGISVNNLGHGHPKIVQAIQRQAAKLIHCTNLYYVEPMLRLAQTLCEHSFADRVCFSNSGAEANEAAMKLARKYAKEAIDPGRTDFISFKNSFHGRTMATLTATGQEKIQHGFEPLVPGYSYAEFNNLDSVRALATGKTIGVIVEPVQGEGGIIPADPAFLAGLRALCDERKMLLIYDEIQCGLGRIGRNFAYEHYGVVPDIMTLAKALGGGLPLGAVLARDEIARAFTPGSHGGTMIGNPVACAAGLAYCEELFENGLAETARARGEELRGKLLDLAKRRSAIREVRGLGLMLAIQLDRPSAEIHKALERNGLLVISIAGDALRLLPPLNVASAEIDEAVGILDRVLGELD
ncbi:MAG: Acetylornithine aminotransferase [candidate division BRC1 bacterium ADurb.BinA364]|nr:MAG: Acetylornithine aminotransferase [candidate division BRC1 bacterium ADurb.BinA364]